MTIPKNSVSVSMFFTIVFSLLFSLTIFPSTTRAQEDKIQRPSGSRCEIHHFTVPQETSIASGLKVYVQWDSDCKKVVLEVNSGSYTARYFGANSGSYVFTAPVGTVYSSTDTDVDVTIIGTIDDRMTSLTSSVPIVDTSAPATTQCSMLDIHATPTYVTQSNPVTTISWQAEPGCIVFIEQWFDTPIGLDAIHINNPVTGYFGSRGSVSLTLTKSSTFYISAQAGTIYRNSNDMVESAATIDVAIL